MSGKEKAENFDDDFELDALDEASWSDDESASNDGASESSEVSGESQANIKKAPREKKSGGGMLTGIVVLALLGGGSFYAYQSGMIPGVGPGQQGAVGESIIPGLTDSAASLETLPQENAIDTAAASSDSAEQMPPMPEAATEPAGEIVMTDTSVAGDSASVAAPLEATDEEALTPMPEGEGAVELTPLDSADGDLEIAQVAEKDGMLSAIPDQVVPGSSDVAAVDGKLQDGVMAVPGASDLAEGEGKELVGDAPTSDSVALDEAALLGETEKTPSAEVAPAADSGVTAEQDALNELSDELEGSQIKEQAASSLESDLKAVEAASEPDLKKDPAGEELTGAVPADSGKSGLAGSTVADAPSVANTSAAPAVPEPSAVQESTVPAAESPAASPVEAALPQAAPAPAQTKTEPPAATASPEAPAEAQKVTEMPEAEAAKEPAVAAEKPKEAAAQPIEPAKPAKPAVMPNWVLKSAKPGIAVLYDKRTGDVKTVGVGDRVAGLGRIRSVSKVDGRWVVEGTGGKVRQ